MDKANRSTQAQNTSQHQPRAIRQTTVEDALSAAIDPLALPGLPAGAAFDSLVVDQASRLEEGLFLSAQRQALAARINQKQGNLHLARLVEPVSGVLATVQRAGGGGHAASSGPAHVQHAEEYFYDVTGATLDEVNDQVTYFGGYAAQTDYAFHAQGRPTQQDDGSYRGRVRWVVTSMRVGLPRWGDYSHACAAAKAEWRRYMGRVRQHEQEAHVDYTRTYLAELGDVDRLITGATEEEWYANLNDKLIDLQDRLQAHQDSCDHGASIDAILHPENGVCEEEEG